MHMAKVKFLKQYGFILAPRCPSVLPNVQGDFMVINKERTYASVGYDAEDLATMPRTWLLLRISICKRSLYDHLPR